MAFWLDLLIFVISAIPLHLSVKILGGKTNLLKTLFVVFISGILVTAINNTINFFGGLIAFIALIAIYHYFFRLKWLKSLLAWFLQFVFLAIMVLILIVFFGLSLGLWL